jgi:hypothetical protein
VTAIANPSLQDPSDDIRIAEYAATQLAYLHYDAFRWQAGSFLIAGVFIFWGLLLQQTTPGDVAGVAALLVTALMSTWLLFAHHYRQIYLCKLHRLHELERDLGMKQHLRFKSREYDAVGPRGHTLDLAVYLITIAGTPALGIAKNHFEWWYIPPMVLGLAVACAVVRNERRGPILPEPLSLQGG